MSQIVTIGYVVEGSTDSRFLENIIRRTFEYIILNCDRQIDIYPLQLVNVYADKFNEKILLASKKAYNDGLTYLCIHCDADKKDDQHTRKYKIDPSFYFVKQNVENTCQNLISVVPIRMSEAWMLADKEVFKEEINTSMGDADLGIGKNPEQYADPKDVITKAIAIAQSHLSRRRQKLNISDIYLPLGQKIKIEKLLLLPSYKKFFIEVNNFLNCID